MLYNLKQIQKSSQKTHIHKSLTQCSQHPVETAQDMDNNETKINPQTPSHTSKPASSGTTEHKPLLPNGLSRCIEANVLKDMNFKSNTKLVISKAQMDAISHNINHPVSLLVMEMGWGKTLTVLLSIGFIRRNKPKKYSVRPILITAPDATVLSTWKEEIIKYTNWVNDTLFITSKSQWPKKESEMSKYKIIVISHSQLTAVFRQGYEKKKNVDAYERSNGTRGFESGWRAISHREGGSGNILIKTQYCIAVADEIHHMKNRNTVLNAAFDYANRGSWNRIGLTGTPVINSHIDFAGIAKALNAAITEDIKLISKHQLNEAAVGVLNDIRNRVMFKPHTEDRGFDLPALSYMIHEVNHGLGMEYLEYYNAWLERAQNLAINMERSRDERAFFIELIKALGQLKRCSVVPQMIDYEGGSKAFNANKLKEAAEYPLPRLTKAVELAKQEVEKYGKTTIFSVDNKVPLQVLDIMLNKEGLKTAMICGGQSAEERARLIKQIVSTEKGAPQVALIMLKVGGVGIQLLSEQMRSVVFISPDYAFKNMEQGIARLYRRGQKNNVTAHFIIAKGTVDEGMMYIHRDKLNAHDIITKATAITEETANWKQTCGIAKSCYALRAMSGVEIGDDVFPERADSAKIHDPLKWADFLFPRRPENAKIRDEAKNIRDNEIMKKGTEVIQRPAKRKRASDEEEEKEVLLELEQVQIKKDVSVVVNTNVVDNQIDVDSQSDSEDYGIGSEIDSEVYTDIE